MGRYAVVVVGTHQYQVEENKVFEVETLGEVQPSSELKLDQVLLVRENGTVKIGQPFVPQASVTCEVLGEIKQPKVISFKFKRRKGYKKKIGHRQRALRLRVKSIQIGS